MGSKLWISVHDYKVNKITSITVVFGYVTSASKCSL